MRKKKKIEKKNGTLKPSNRKQILHKLINIPLINTGYILCTDHSNTMMIIGINTTNDVQITENLVILYCHYYNPIFPILPSFFNLSIN